MAHTDTLVLSAKDASLLVSNRSSLPKRCYLSLKGSITAMSNVIRMKNEDSFLLEIDHCVNIIVKDYHLAWHSQLVPLETFVFYHLRLTTIEKGVLKPQPILVVWKSSSVLAAPGHEGIVQSSLKEWLSWMHLDHVFSQINLVVTNDDEADKEMLPLVRGVVDCVAESDDGIYRLDGNVRLFTGLNSSIQGNFCYQIGSKVQVYNAHDVKDASRRSTLVCCVRSFIKSDADSVLKIDVKAVKDSVKTRTSKCSIEDLKWTITKHGLNFTEIQNLLSLKNDLQDLRSEKEVKYILHYLIKSLCGNEGKNDHVSPLDIFFQHEKFCPFGPTMSSENRIRTQMKISQLQELELETNYDDPDVFSSKWRFSKKEWTSEEILLGTLAINGIGDTEFVDQSGGMLVLLIQNWNDQRTCDKSCSNNLNLDQHQCTSCCSKTLNEGESISCPFILQNVIGKLLYTKRFVLVLEEFDQSKKDDSVGRTDTLRYLMFSLQDCVVLEACESGVSCGAVNGRRPFELDFNRCDDFMLSNDHQTACLMYVSEKSQRSFSKKHGKYFHLNGRLCDPFKLDLKTNESFLEKRSIRSNLVGSGKNIADVLMDDEVVCCKEDVDKAIKRKSTCSDGLYECIAGKERKLENLGERQKDKKSQNLLSKTMPVTLFCKKNNAFVFSFIYPGNFYLLSIPKKNNSPIFQPVFSSEKLRKVMYKFTARISIEAPELLEVEHIYNSALKVVKDRIEKEDELPASSVNEILSDQCKDSLVLFTAVILRKEMKCSVFSSRKEGSKKCKDFFSLREVQLDLCDVDQYLNAKSDLGLDSASVYIDRPDLHYVLGLIPGSVVVLRSVERKVSKAQNVYFKFIAVSSIQVKAHIPLAVLKSSDRLLSSKSFESSPVDYIGNIWNRELGDTSNLRRTWCIECHVCVVFSLKLCLVCKKCKGIFVQNACQSRGCYNVTSFDVDAYSVVLVEDGTSQAVIKLRRCDLVRKLLTLNQRQWDDTVSLLHNLGLVYMSKQTSASSSSPLETFLGSLIKSPVVVRPLRMLIRVFKDSHSYETVAKMKEEEFAVKPLRVGNGPLIDNVLHLPLMELDCVDLEDVKH